MVWFLFGCYTSLVVFFWGGGVISLILLWSCICRGLTLNLSQARICEILLSVQALFFFFLKWYCLPSVVGLSYAHYFSKVFPETEGMCRADVWCNATSLRRWTSECFCFFFITFWAKILCSTWIKWYSLFYVEVAEIPHGIFYKMWMKCD